MSNVYNGFADIRTIGTAETVTIGGYASVFIDSLPAVHRANVTEHLGTDGTTAAIIHTNQYIELAISFRPASKVSVADVEAKAILLPKGSKVTLSGFSPISLDAADVLNGDWILVGDATLTRNSGDAGIAELTIRNYLDKQAGLLVQVPATVP